MAGRQSAPRRSAERAWFITGPLAILAVIWSTGLGILAGDGGTERLVGRIEHPVGAWVVAAALLVFMVVTEGSTLHFVIRRQAIIATLTEIPLVLALFYLQPLTVVLIFTLATLISQLRRRVGMAKASFNVAKTAAATSLAGLVLQALPPMTDAGPRTLANLFIAVSTITLVTFAAVIVVVTLIQGAQAGWEMTRTAAPNLVVAGANVSVGLIVLIALVSTWWSLLLLALLASGLALVGKSYAQFFRQHRTLADMYDLTRAMTQSGQDGTLTDVMLGRVRSLMQAEYATLWLPAQGRHPEVLLTARVDDPGLLDLGRTPLIARRLAVQEKRTVAVGGRLDGDEEVRAALRADGAKDVIVAPLRSGQAVIGTLEVVNRLSDSTHFLPGDVPVFETIAAHVAVALENSRLVDRLRHDAYHDGLVNLPNRRRMTEALEEAVRVRAPGEVVAVLLFDVDGLRQVNESLGHAAGDEVLTEVASRLRSCAPAAALVGRIGGDEFLVTLRAENAEAATELAAEAARADPGPDGLRHIGPRRRHRGRGGGPSGSRQRPGDAAAPGRPGSHRGEVDPGEHPAVQPGAGVPLHAPPGPRGRPASGPGQR